MVQPSYKLMKALDRIFSAAFLRCKDSKLLACSWKFNLARFSPSRRNMSSVMCGYLILVASLLIAGCGAESLWVYFEVKKVCLACVLPPESLAGVLLGEIRGRQWRKQYLIGPGQAQEKTYSLSPIREAGATFRSAMKTFLGIWRHFCIWNQATVQAKCYSPSHVETFLVRGRTKLHMCCKKDAGLCGGLLRPELLPSMYMVWTGLEGRGVQIIIAPLF